MFASLRTPIALFVTLTQLVEFLPDPSPRLPQVALLILENCDFQPLFHTHFTTSLKAPTLSHQLHLICPGDSYFIPNLTLSGSSYKVKTQHLFSLGQALVLHIIYLS